MRVTYLEERNDAYARVSVQQAYVARDRVSRRYVNFGIQHLEDLAEFLVFDDKERTVASRTPQCDEVAKPCGSVGDPSRVCGNHVGLGSFPGITNLDVTLEVRRRVLVARARHTLRWIPTKPIS